MAWGWEEQERGTGDRSSGNLIQCAEEQNRVKMQRMPSYWTPGHFAQHSGYAFSLQSSTLTGYLPDLQMGSGKRERFLVRASRQLNSKKNINRSVLRKPLPLTLLDLTLYCMAACSSESLNQGSSDGKEFPFSAGDSSSIPGSRRSPGGAHGNRHQCSCLENPRDRGASRATSMGSQTAGHSWRTEQRLLHFQSRFL